MSDFDSLYTDIGTQTRLRAITDCPIDAMVCAPGHRTLRHPEAVVKMAERIRSGSLGDLLDEPILIGIFATEPAGRVAIRAIECLDGNHRLLGGLLSGVWKRIGDIPIEGLDTRVNGWAAHATGPEGRWIPLEVARASTLDPSQWFEVPASWGAKGPTAQIPGHISSIDPVFPVGCRGISLGQLLDTWRRSTDTR